MIKTKGCPRSACTDEEAEAYKYSMGRPGKVNFCYICICFELSALSNAGCCNALLAKARAGLSYAVNTIAVDDATRDTERLSADMVLGPPSTSWIQWLLMACWFKSQLGHQSHVFVFVLPAYSGFSISTWLTINSQWNITKRLQPQRKSVYHYHVLLSKQRHRNIDISNISEM